MGLVNTKAMLDKAMYEGYAIGAFNINNMESIQGVMEAANEMKSPVILQVSMSAIKYAGLNYIVKMLEAAVEEYPNIPVALHLDHGTDLNICKKCIDSGFTSVMIDGSMYDFEENIKITKEVVEYAHAKDVVVEAELGKLVGVEDEINEGIEVFTNPLHAKEFVERTGCDSLAIAIGTSHGACKFKNQSKLRLDILKKIKEELPNTPLVLHGASSVMQELVLKCNIYGGDIQGVKGVEDKHLKEVCKLGICKINVDTDLRLAMTSGLRKVLFEDSKVIDPRKYLSEGRYFIKEVVKYKMENVFDSKDKI